MPGNVLHCRPGFSTVLPGFIGLLMLFTCCIDTWHSALRRAPPVLRFRAEVYSPDLLEQSSTSAYGSNLQLHLSNAHSHIFNVSHPFTWGVWPQAALPQQHREVQDMWLSAWFNPHPNNARATKRPYSLLPPTNELTH